MTASGDEPTTAMPAVGSGRVLGARYELGSVLGAGGMATVFRARDGVLHREVAVKVLHAQFATDPTFLARFSREALDAARLSHPGLVTIFDAGVDQGTAYIVMELVHGRTVQELLTADGPLAIARAVGIAADVCDVLDVAHRAGVVHRDIKPGNILVGDDGRTRVFDFGIARASGSAALTEISTVVGTAEYLSPEQATGAPADARSDLYALGCVLDAMLTGSPPFAAEAPVALLHRHVHDAPEPPSARRPEVSAALDVAVLHLLAKDPADRPASAAEARHELLGTLAPSAGATLVLPNVPAAEPSARRPSVAAVVVVVGSCLVTFAVLMALFLARGEGTPTTATGSPSSSPSSSPSRSSETPTVAPTTPSAPSSPTIVVPVATTTAAALDAVRQVVAAGQSAGLVDASAATRLENAIDDVAGAVDRKKGRSAGPRIQELAGLVDSLAAEGRVAPAAAAALRAAVEQLRQVVGQGG